MVIYRSLKKGGDLMKNLVLGLTSSFCKCLTRLVYGTKRIECSKVMVMDGRVKSAVFIPSHSEMQSVTQPGYWGYDSFNGDSLLYLFAEVPDHYETVFNSERGAIILQTKEAFETFKRHEGELVTITFCEIYESIFNKKTNRLIKLIDVNFKVLGVSLK